VFILGGGVNRQRRLGIVTPPHLLCRGDGGGDRDRGMLAQHAAERPFALGA